MRAAANFPNSGRTTFTMPVEVRTGVAVIRERPEASVASHASSTSSSTATSEKRVLRGVWSLPRRKRPILSSDARAGVTSIACDPRHPSLARWCRVGPTLLFDGRTQTCVGRSP